MCMQTTCNKCQKEAYVGCGMHLTGIFRNIPVEKRCFCGYTEEELEQEKKSPKNPELGPLPKPPQQRY
eukprot:gene7123-11286_t